MNSHPPLKPGRSHQRELKGFTSKKEKRNLHKIGGKRKKNSKIYKDKISELPEEILCFILSMLTVREATKTSILSHRWRWLWKASLASSSRLNLDVSIMGVTACFNPDVSAMRDSHCVFDNSKLLKLELNELPTEKRKFAKLIQPILQLDHSSPKDSCRLCFCLDSDFADLIDQFVKLALAKRCQNLEIDLSPFQNTPDGCRREDKYYTFPSHFPTLEIVSSVKCLCLKTCNLKFFQSNIFKSLVDLHLEYVLIDDVIISSILSNCPDLEKLCLVKCNQLVFLNINNPSLKLKCLSVVFCEGLRKINIDSKMLTWFYYYGEGTEIKFLKVPQLANVMMRPITAEDTINYALTNLSIDLPQLKYLFLNVDSVKRKEIPRQLPTFANLKKLVLSCCILRGSLWEIIPLLKAAPHLHRLELNLLARNLEYEDGPTEFQHLHLQEIMMSGFSDFPWEIELAKYLLNIAVTLKQFTILSEFFMYESYTGSLPKISKEKMQRLKEQKANGSRWEALAKVARPGVELLFE